MTAPSFDIPGYELIRELGAGGMAIVYLAVQRSLDRKVAIKVMRRNIDEIDKFERRFLMEGRTMAKLPHRNIVAVYDIVKTDEYTYIAMEYLEAGTLSLRMKEGLSLAEAISVVVQIGQALQFAHDHGIVHRDLKPANIMFRDAYTPVLTDFGIAKQQDATATRLTQTGMLVGTPTYMSPEQINALDVDGRSDLYSLGVLFYELLTGNAPFTGDTPIAVLMAHLTTPPPPLPKAFGDFQACMDRMLAKNRDDRFANLRDFTRALKSSVVGNQNLWARLQSDPSQSSSEQLRALGFSISGPASLDTFTPPPGTQQVPKPGQATGERRASSSRGPGVIMPAGKETAPPPSRERKAPPPPQKRMLLIAGSALIAIALAVGGYALWKRKPAQPEELAPNIRLVVDSSLRDVDRFIAEGKLASPPGENAYEYLRGVMDLAPGYEGTRKRVQALADEFKKQSQGALAQKDFDTADARLEQARLVNPGDQSLTALKAKVAEGRKLAADSQQIADLVAKAEAAEQAGKLFGAEGAYVLFERAQQLSPKDEAIKKRIEALVANALKPARDALAAGKVTEAQTRLAELEPFLANDASWKAARTEFDKAQNAALERQRLESLLSRFDAELRAGRLNEPAGDNALETLAQLRGQDGANPEVVKRQDALAAKVMEQADAAQRAGRGEAALVAANLALDVKPGFPPALALKQSVEKSLDANKVKVSDGLAAAQRAITAQRFLAPAGDNAKDLLEGVLKLDPANASAKGLLTELPKRIADAAKARAQNNDLAGALELIESARKVYPADTALAAMSTDYTRQQGETKAKEERAKRYERLAQLIATRPLSADNSAAATKEIQALLSANARDVDATTARKRLFDALDEQLAAAQSASDIDQFTQVLKPVRQQFATDAETIALVGKLDARQRKVAEDEKARIAASQGELVLNAYPWATVESITDASGKAVPLPSDATTPLRVTLPAGVYNVTFRHPQVQRTARQVAQVQAKGTVTVAAAFSTISSRDYLKRAGW